MISVVVCLTLVAGATDFDVRDALKPGENEIVIDFESTDRKAYELAAAASSAPFAFGVVRTTSPRLNYVRTPAR